MLTTVAAMLALAPGALDQGALIGLRAQDGSLRTILVSQRGVAYVSKEHKGSLLKSNKEAVLSYALEGEDLLFQHSQRFKIGGKFRVGWLANSGLGLEFDASKSGEKPYSRVFRRVVRLFNSDVVDCPLSSVLSQLGNTKVRQAAERFHAQPNETDWGYVRNQGKWDLVATVGAADERREITITGETFTATPSNQGEISWREVVSEHPDVTDLVASVYSPFAVVVTPTQLIVREASRTSLGRVIRRIPADSETVVHYEFSGGGPLEAWHRYIKD